MSAADRTGRHRPAPDAPAESPAPLPQRAGLGPAELLEQLRAALRICSPVLYVRLHAPDGENPNLYTKRGRNERRITVASEPGGYQWVDTREDIGHAGDIDRAARHVAQAMGAPIRGM